MEYTQCKQAEVSNDGKKVKVKLTFDNSGKVEVEMDEKNAVMLVMEIVNHINSVTGTGVKYEIGRRQTAGIKHIEGTEGQEGGQEGECIG